MGEMEEKRAGREADVSFTALQDEHRRQNETGEAWWWV